MRRITALLLVPGLAHAFETDDFEGLAPTVDPGEAAPIINGEPATADDFPMAGGMLVGGTISAFGFELEGKLAMCSSTLIAPDVVLLAAHCVDLEAMLQAPQYQGIEILDTQFAWSRKADLSMYSMTPQSLSNPPDWPDDVAFATEVVPHPEFNIFTLQVGLAKNYDVALMFLEEPVLDVPYAFLPTPDEDAQLGVGTEVDIVGWGQQSADPYGPSLAKQWGTSFIAEEAPYEMKIGDAVDDVRKCHGDSGGPSFAYVETDSTEDMRIVGVTSHAYDFTDCNLTGGVDTRVAFYLDWIDEEMTKRCEDGSRSWCEWPGIIPPPDESGLLPWEGDVGEDDDDDDGDGKKGCGCDSSGGVGGWAVLALVGVLVRRRR